mmetsp:Transcript_26494/g.43317  ORF Transcript_26494/g.43317 Transcript_26494/m.43317 type:complete len:217 (-) Transcript_26494:1136-1786(-)
MNTILLHGTNKFRKQDWRMTTHQLDLEQRIRGLYCTTAAIFNTRDRLIVVSNTMLASRHGTRLIIMHGRDPVLETSVVHYIMLVNWQQLYPSFLTTNCVTYIVQDLIDFLSVQIGIITHADDKLRAISIAIRLHFRFEYIQLQRMQLVHNLKMHSTVVLKFGLDSEHSYSGFVGVLIHRFAKYIGKRNRCCNHRQQECPHNHGILIVINNASIVRS